MEEKDRHEGADSSLRAQAEHRLATESGFAGQQGALLRELQVHQVELQLQNEDPEGDFGLLLAIVAGGVLSHMWR